MAEISWIKLSTGLPDNKKIKRIRKLPDGDKVILFWVFLLARAGESNKSGGLFLTDTLPYSEEDLAADFDFNVEFIHFALITLEKYSMITRYDEVLFIKNWEEYQSIDGMEKVREQNRLRQLKYREKQKQLMLNNVTDNVTHNAKVTPCNGTDIDIDKEIDKEIDKDIKDSRKSRKRVYDDDSSYIQLAKYLYKKILLNGPLKKPNFQTWADDIRKMIELDNRSPDQVKRMIEWCQADSFWNSNILSAKKLREKYDMMARQANRKPQSYSKQSNARREQLPSHIGKQPQIVDISPEKQAEVDKKLAEYLRQQEAEND